MKSDQASAPQKPGRNSGRKWLIALLLSGLFCLTLFSLALFTEPGFRFLVHTADILSGPVFSVQETEGRLLSRWRLGKVKVHIDQQVDLALDEVIFAWSPLALLEKRLVLHQVAVQGLDLRLHGAGKDDKEKERDDPVTLPTIRLPLALELEELHLQDGQIFFSEQGTPLVINEVILQASTQDQAGEAQQATVVDIQRIKLDLRDYGVDLQGQIAFHDAWPMHLKGSWRVADPGINDLDGTVDARGDLDALDLMLTLIAPAEVSLEGKVTDILNDLKWQAAARTGHFHLNDIKVDVPVDGTLTIVEASGTTGSYQGTLAADIHYHGYPPVQAEARVIAADYSGLAVEYLSVHHGESILTTRGQMQWKGGFSWQAELEGEAIDPALVAEKWPGRINGLIKTQGQLGASGTSLEVDINALDGELVGFPLQGSGGMALDKQGIRFHELQLQAGSAQARIDGRIAKDNSLDLKVMAASDDLSRFFPEYAGKVHLQGTATGQQENPGINFVLEGFGLELAGYSLSTIQADLAADLIMEGQESGMKIKELHLLLDHNMALDVSGQIGWGEAISWQTEVRGEQLNPGLFLPEWSGNIQTSIRSQGQKNSEKLVAQVELDELSGTLRGFPLAGKGQVALDGKEIEIKNLHLQSGSTQIEVDGQADEQQVQVAVQARSDDLSSLLPDLQGGFEASVEAQGEPMHPAIKFSITGNDLVFQNYNLQHLQTNVQTNLNLDKGKQAAQVDEFRVVLNNKGAFAATGTVGWGDGISWQVDCNAKQLDPSLFLPEWSGNINAEISSLGQKKGGDLAAAIEIEKLNGTLRDLPLTGTGQAELNNTMILIDDLHLGLGSARIWADGSVDPGQYFDLAFKAESADVADLLPDAQGNFQLQGALQGKGQEPQLNLTVNAENIKYTDYQLKQLDSTIKADLRAQGEIAAHLDAVGIRVKEEEITTLSLDVHGKKEDHRLELALAGTPGKAQLSATGSLQEQLWQGQLTQLGLEHEQFGAWAMARPAALRLSSQEAGLSDFSIQHKKMNIALDGDWRKEGGWQVRGGVNDFNLKLLQDWQLPVPDLSGTAQLSLTAQGKGAVPEQAELSCELPQLSLTTEVFEDDKEEVSTRVWLWTENSIKAQLRDGIARLQAHTQFQNKNQGQENNQKNKSDQQDDSTADLNLVVDNCTNFSKPETMPLRGQLDLDLNDLSPLAYLSNEAVQAKGEFGGRILVSGTVGQPAINGKLALSRGKNGAKKSGEIFIPVAGIGLQDIQIALAGDGRSNTVEAECRSGEGTIQLSGVAHQDAEQGWLADLVLTGKNFQAADLPEYQAVISPDLELHYAGTGTRLSGTVTVDTAEIAPTGFSGAVSASNDVVIVDDEQPVQRASPMYLDLKLIMGDEVMVNTYGLKGFLDGSLQVKAKPGYPVTALGSLDLRDGTFDFEGNMLELSKSRVFYQGGLIENPGLDIQASREINKMELGVHITGSANEMEMRLFSDTAMDESEILSYLLTGQDISQSGDKDKALSPAEATLGKVGGGVLLKTVDPLKTLDMEGMVDLSIGGGEDASDVSLVMGKEIYKDLYISYGKDLTGAGGTFKARYDIFSWLSVETATNAGTSGADLLFSWER